MESMTEFVELSVKLNKEGAKSLILSMLEILSSEEREEIIDKHFCKLCLGSLDVNKPDWCEGYCYNTLQDS